MKTILKKHDIEFDGLFMMDMSQANGIYANGEPLSEVGIRRARLGLSGDISRRLSAEIAVDIEVEDSSASLHEASLEFDWTKALEMNVGLVKQPFGLEGSTSSKHVRTLERSMATDVFAPDRGVGIALSHESSNHYLSLGAYRDQDVEDVQDITARATWSPLNSKRRVLHAGASVSRRDNGGVEYRVRSSGNISSGENFLKSARFNPDSISTLGIEAGFMHGSFLIQAEWFRQSLAVSDTQSADGEPVFSGSYVQAGWVFGNGYRKYDGRRFGKIAGTKSRRALELVAGVGLVDVRHADTGDQAREVTLGLNYQLTRYLSMGAQFQSVTALNNNQSLESGKGVLLRLVATL